MSVTNAEGSGARAARVAIVTGGGRGIGRTIARALAAAGAAVAVVARTEAEVIETAALIRSEGGQALALTADVTRPADVEGMVEQAERELGPVDFLVNNAGRAHALGPLWEVDPDDWWRDVEVNLRSTFLCSRAVLPGMIARGGGRMVNVVTRFATEMTPYFSAYGSAKAAVLHLAGGLAETVRQHGVKVFGISPGLVRTALTDYLANSPAGRKWVPEFSRFQEGDWWPPERAGELVVFLASGQADELAGRYIHVSQDWVDMARQADGIS